MNGTSSDFNTVRALVNGEIDTFMGFKFIRTERLPLVTPGGVIRKCAACTWGAIGAAVTRDIATQMSIRDDKNYSMQIFSDMSYGATRTEEVKVIEVHVDESA